MDSACGSGTKNQDDTKGKEPVDSLRESEEESSSAAADDDTTESPPSVPQSEITEVGVHGTAEAEGQNPSAATATDAAAEQKSKELSLFWSAWGSQGDKAPLPPSHPSAATATDAAAEQKSKELSLFWSAWGSPGDKAPLPSSHPSVPAGGKPPLPPRRPTGGKPPLPPRPGGSKPPLPRRPPAVWRIGRSSENIDLKDVFDELMQEVRENSGETDQEGKAEEMPRQQDEQAKSPGFRPKLKGKKPLWRKVLDRIGISNQKYTPPHVYYEKLHITELIRHYNLLELVAGQGVLFHSHALMLRRDYSAFRPVLGDGECFYRSFIFSYLEQVLDRQDTHEEHRVLAAVRGVARQHARLMWDSEFPRSHKAFKKLIKKVMRCKTHRRWKHVPTAISYRIEKLLKFFNDNERILDIFTFLRLVAAIWICSHSEEFVPLIPEVNDIHTLTQWCFQEVIQRKVFTDHIQITALLRALQVPLRVEYLFQEAGQDLYTSQGSQDDMPRSTCWPRRHQVPPDHEVPRVTLLYTQEHYDIMYPFHPDGPVTSGESSGQQSDKTKSLEAKSPSGETSSQQIDRVEGSTSSGEKSDKHPVTSGDSSDQRSDKTKSPSDETSSQQIGQVEGSSSTGEKSDKHTAKGKSIPWWKVEESSPWWKDL